MPDPVAESLSGPAKVEALTWSRFRDKVLYAWVYPVVGYGGVIALIAFNWHGTRRFVWGVCAFWGLAAAFGTAMLWAAIAEARKYKSRGEGDALKLMRISAFSLLIAVAMLFYRGKESFSAHPEESGPDVFPFLNSEFKESSLVIR